jgi:DNA-binding FadR family transcriptional regulator
MIVAGISGNRSLDLISRSLKAIYDLCVPAGLLPHHEQHVRTVHEEITAAIFDGRGSDAEQLMREHLDKARASTAAQFPGLLAEPVEWA